MAKRKLNLPPLHNSIQDDDTRTGKGRASRPWTHWFDELQRRLNESAGKVVSGTTNNILILDADGDPSDGGKELPTGDVVGTTDIQTLTRKTLTTPTIASFANAQHDHENAAGGGKIDEGAITLNNVTTLDVSISKHGLVPKAPADATKFLRGDADWGVPTGVVPSAHQLDGALHTVSGLTPGHFLKAASAVTFAFAAHGLTYTDVGAAPTAKGVTNGDSHDHDGGDGAQIDHGGLGGLSDDDHTQYTKKSTLAAQGDIYYASAASTPAALSPGTAGKLLQTGGASANPSWVAGDSITLADVTTGDAGTTKHGWLLKATAPAAGLINVVGIGNGETVYSNKALFDATVPSTQAFGDSAATGSATVASRRDHKHAMPANPSDASIAVTDVTTNNATTSAHGFLLKATAPAAGTLNVVGIGNGETAYACKTLFDATNPAAIGTAAPGTSLYAAHRDHVHAASHTALSDKGTYTHAQIDTHLAATSDPHGSTLTQTVAIKVPKIYPSSDSVTAIQFTQADGSTAILNVDSTNKRLGIGSTAPAAALHVINATGICQVIGNNQTDSTLKYGILTGGHYLNAEEPVCMIRVAGDSSTNTVTIGGGSTVANSATTLAFYTAANYNTLTGTERMRISSVGNILINDTANAKATNALTVNQLVASDECLALKQNNILHAFTTDTEADTFATFKQVTADAGGLAIRGYSDAAGTTGLFLAGAIGNASPTAGIPAVILRGQKLSGTTVEAMATTEVVAQIQNYTTVLSTWYASGNLGHGIAAPAAVLHIAREAATVWSTDFTGGPNYTPYTHEVVIDNSCDDTVGSFAGIYFKAGETSAGAAINSARIAAIREAATSTALAFSVRSGATGNMTERFRINSLGNLGFGGVSAWGTSAQKVIGGGSGTAPSTAPADMAQMWVADYAAGFAGWWKMTETTAQAEVVPGVIIKATTGSPSSPYEGLMEINTYDNKVRMYADGGWRELGTW